MVRGILEVSGHSMKDSFGREANKGHLVVPAKGDEPVVFHDVTKLRNAESINT